MLTLHVTDQGVNARVCEKKEVGIEVPREEEDEAFLRGDLAETVRKVMAVKEGRRFRDKAAEEREKVLGNRAIHNWLFSTLLCFQLCSVFISLILLAVALCLVVPSAFGQRNAFG
ncbi:UDP-glycosyltransferase 91B1 [Linum perenne]